MSGRASRIATATVLLSFVAALVAGCFADFVGCAEDGSCPGTLSCVDKRCVDLDVKPCVTSSNCPRAFVGESSNGPPSCQAGVCASRKCGDAVRCAPGEVCAVEGRPFSGSICFADCTNASCGPGLQCVDLGYGGRKICVGEGESSPLDRACAPDAYDPCLAGASCLSGICSFTCDVQRCPTGRTCAPNGVCVLDCTSGEACPSDLTCGDLFDGKRGCIRPDIGLNFCTGVVTEGP